MPPNYLPIQPEGNNIWQGRHAIRGCLSPTHMRAGRHWISEIKGNPSYRYKGSWPSWSKDLPLPAHLHVLHLFPYISCYNHHQSLTLSWRAFLFSSFVIAGEGSHMNYAPNNLYPRWRSPGVYEGQVGSSLLFLSWPKRPNFSLEVQFSFSCNPSLHLNSCIAPYSTKNNEKDNINRREKNTQHLDWRLWWKIINRYARRARSTPPWTG